MTEHQDCEEFHDLADDELLARLIQRDCPEALAMKYVEHREVPITDTLIWRLLCHD